ncbi:hypothetical protein LBMAG46_16980 [Planctomycetia bacterium]|nr:hypothetical protein LBMAG46_16980 [Planctomycetia bacterium]
MDCGNVCWLVKQDEPVRIAASTEVVTEILEKTDANSVCCDCDMADEQWLVDGCGRGGAVRNHCPSGNALDAGGGGLAAALQWAGFHVQNGGG